MEKFFIPKDRTKFIHWILQKANENDWTIVFEYSIDNAYSFINKIGTEVPLPISSRNHYETGYSLIAIKDVMPTDQTINQLMLVTHVLSVHNNKEMLFLINDDFHEDCFSCSIDFYNNNHKTIYGMNLAETYDQTK